MTHEVLLIEVRLHEPRFHGTPEWPPSPWRLYQALVAGVGPKLADAEVREALEWLECLAPPTIAAPRHHLGQEVTLYVPNNDLDTKGGDPSRVGKIRAAKSVRPRLLAGKPTFLYAWRAHTPPPAGVDAVVDALYQFGRGIDPAHASSSVVSEHALDDILWSWPGDVFFPAGGAPLPCPCRGSLVSLEQRHEAQSRRLTVERVDRRPVQVFQQPPKATSADVGYGSGPVRHVFEIRTTDQRDFSAKPLAHAHDLVVAVRDAAAERLSSALDKEELVRGVLVGHPPHAPKLVAQSDRVRIAPLPSIGHPEADPSIRRVLVETPRTCPLPLADIRWAFSGLEIEHGVLVDAGDPRMLRHYAGPSRVWTTITPAALPHIRTPRSGKSSPARAAEQSRAQEAVHQALRHEGHTTRVLQVEAQREPFTHKGELADRFRAGRFGADRLWHLRLHFAEPVAGPLLLGDGRYLGLGLLHPQQSEQHPVVHTLRIESGLQPGANPGQLARALRRAVMARYQRRWRGPLPSWVSGHADGRPAREHRHLRYLTDLPRSRLLVVLDGGPGQAKRLAAALQGFEHLRAGTAGVLTLQPTHIDRDDPILAPSRSWSTVTPYAVNRHLDKGSPGAAVEADVRASLSRAGLPTPTAVNVRQARSGERGLTGHVQMEFEVAVRGPMAFGRTSHLGGGLFVGRT